MNQMPVSTAPEPLDDNWWAAIMLEEPEHCHPKRSALPLTASSPLADWQKTRELYEHDEPLEITVTGYNRGGLLVTYNALHGFIPASHLVNFPIQMAEDARAQALAQRVGQRLRAKVIEHDAERGRVVFSERAARSGPGSRQALLATLNPGVIATGVITNVCDFGAFVDLGGVEGLIHVSEISWCRVAHPREVLRCNQTVQVMVLTVMPDQGRVALSLKRTRPDPWQNVDARYLVGQQVSGVITNVVNFGAFVALEEGLEGLIHVSELADGHFLHPRNVVQEGQRVEACVVHVDRNGRRLALSLRRQPTAALTVA